MTKRGFIATSVLFSFFLVFIMIMTTNLVLDANTGHLTSALKKDIRNKIEQNSSFINYTLTSKNYAVGETVNFAGEDWQVLKDNGNNDTLILKRSLNKTEILSALPNISISNTEYFTSGSCTDSICRIRACRYALIGTESCYTYNSSIYLAYSWNPTTNFAKYGRSVINIVVESWFSNHLYLQTAKSRKILQEMSIIDGIFNNYRSYIRIPYSSEATSNIVWGNGTDFHTATKGNVAYQTWIYDGTRSVSKDSTTLSQIRPVIIVKEG